MRIFLFILNFASLLIGSSSFATHTGFCGTIDFRKVTNFNLENFFYFGDLEKKENPKKRIQCGIPGEKIKLCSSCVEELSEDSMKILRPVIGSKEHLRWHDRWHKVRALDEIPTPEQYKKFQDQGLFPSDISAEDFFKKYNLSSKGELAGENFFYMHRMMIKMVQFELAMNDQPCLSSWSKLPVSNTDPQGKKRSDLQAILDRYSKKEFLRSTTLNGFGLTLEATLHQRLHEYYRGPIVDGRACSKEALAQGYCDDLLPNSTSPLNKYFWKIHGLVDELLGRWLEANGYQEVSTNCRGRERCYELRGTWVGQYPRP